MYFFKKKRAQAKGCGCGCGMGGVRVQKFYLGMYMYF